VEKTIYLGISPDHSHDTYKLLKVSNNEIIYRRNVYFIERSIPARKFKPQSTIAKINTGEELVGLDFEDDGQQWTITEVGFYEERPVLYYKNKNTEKK
jgi:hypothetical protein